jgi:hypothetical protein
LGLRRLIDQTLKGCLEAFEQSYLHILYSKKMWWKQVTAVAVVGLASMIRSFFRSCPSAKFETRLALAASFKNPIIPGFNPDPTIARAGKDYFLATSTFEYFPGAPIYHSRDL